MKLLISSFLFLFFCLSAGTVCNGQNSKVDYIVIDSALMQGLVTPYLDKGWIQFRKSANAGSTIYDLSDVTEYSFDGKIYESVNIDGKRQFAEKIAAGKISVYRYKATYILKHDSTFTQMSKKDYRNKLISITSCEGSKQSLKKLDYSKAAIRKYIDSYNKGKCESDHLPYKKIGVLAGNQNIQFNVKHKSTTTGGLYSLEGDEKGGLLGIFADFPAYEPAALFLSTEIYWLSLRETSNTLNQYGPERLDFKANGFNSIINAKWIVLPGSKVKPYIKGGILITYLKSTSHLETNIPSEKGLISIDESMKVSALFFGFSSGLGLEFPLKNRLKLHTEVKYLKSITESKNSIITDLSGVYLMMGISF